jgi:hypothetical protein
MFKGSRALPLLKASRPKFFLILILASLLALDGLYPAAAVLAAPSQDPTGLSYTLEVGGTEKSVCVGETRTIPVNLRQVAQVIREDGEVITTADQGAPASATIEGSVSDPAVGTLAPSTGSTGWGANYTGRGQVDFQFRGLKAGTTVLAFKAETPDAVSFENNDITVIDCPYDVYMVAIAVALTGEVKIWTTGVMMTTRVAPQGGAMSGEGDLRLKSGFGGPTCKIAYSAFVAPTHILGPLVKDDQLKLKFRFEPAEMTNYVSCPGGGDSAPHSIDLNVLRIPESTFPVGGGVVVKPVSYMGTNATFIITAMPVRE